MAKKSQTNARRNNTQAGRRVVNFYNNGTVNIDARQNNSTSPKSTYSYCTIYHTPQSGRPFTIKDHIEDEHIILDMISSGETMSSSIISSPRPASAQASISPESSKRMEKLNPSHKPSKWGWVVLGGSVAITALLITAKYLITK